LRFFAKSDKLQKMYQVIYRIPVRVFNWMPAWLPDYLPIFGYGSMLFCAFLVCIALANWRAKRLGIDKNHIQDLALWIFGTGILGARITFMVQYHEPVENFFKIWNGGLVFYGSFIGGAVGYAFGHFFIIRKHGLSVRKMADIIAPCVAIGLCLGRVGCFLNGCCYGNVACADCPAVHFPLCSPPRYALVKDGLQTAAGFSLTDTLGRPTVAAIECNSAAAASGLRPGDVIVEAEGQPIGSSAAFSDLLLNEWPRGETRLALKVSRPGEASPVALPPFVPKTLGLQPTQLYESISTFLLLLVLSAYFPLRKRDGEVMALFLVGYALHRFLNEILRNDTDPVWGTPLTLSQNLSILFLIVGIGLFLWLRRQPVQYGAEPAPVRPLRPTAPPVPSRQNA
jgi:phosphatidylglycerol:prolipoprotein diacylglycerol transferase